MANEELPSSVQDALGEQPGETSPPATEEDLHLDPAQQSLADALRVSFFILKLAMVALVIAYACSGIFSVGSNELAMRLRFGDYVGSENQRVLERGTQWAMPFPIEQVVKISTRPQTLRLENEFWYEVPPDKQGMTRDQLVRFLARSLDPVKDGSHITGDFNIVHGQWVVDFQIQEPEDFVENVGEDRLATHLVRVAAQQGIMQAVAEIEADQFLKGAYGGNADKAMSIANRSLREMRTGIAITKITQEKASPPLRVAGAFDAVTKAVAQRSQQILAAQSQRAKVLGETAGEAASDLLKLIDEYERVTEIGDVKQREAIAEQIDSALVTLKVGKSGMPIRGRVARIINDASAYRTSIVEKVKADAETFNRLLPQYERSPRIILSRLWEEARESILSGDVETFYTPPGKVSLKLSRDPDLVNERERKQLQKPQN